MTGSDKGERRVHAAALVALYLRGGPGGALAGEASRWPKVWDALRADAPTLGAVPPALRRRGLWAEAAALDAPGVLSGALALVEASRAVTPSCPAYPARWLAALGTSAPPAVWASGTVPVCRVAGVAGSRRPTPQAERWLAAVVSGLAAAGLSLVSGGAHGVDRLAVAGMARACGEGRAVEVLPCGLDAASPAPGVARLAPWAPDAPFSTGQAMARNALLYAASPVTLVVQPRFRTGGTWAGAADALRRRLSSVVVWGPPGCPACTALVALGAVLAPAAPAEAAAFVAGLVSRPARPPQPSLFGAGVVREALGSVA